MIIPFIKLASGLFLLAVDFDFPFHKIAVDLLPRTIDRDLVIVFDCLASETAVVRLQNFCLQRRTI